MNTETKKIFVQNISKPKLIFWDFDGVIKDSVEVKTQAFFNLFIPYGIKIAKRISEHHESNAGMSRYDKLPLYLSWAGEEPTKEKVVQLCEQFNELTIKGVIDSQWVPGVENYLRTNPNNQLFILVSATPQKEIEFIINSLDLYDCFSDIIGTPTKKINAISKSLEKYGIDPQDCIMIGDAQTDMEAANANQVPFLLRQHKTNTILSKDYLGKSFQDFSEL